MIPTTVFKVLGDENRLRIFLLLLVGKRCSCEIEDVLALSQSNTSRHLTKLKQADMIVGKKEAQWIHYTINPFFSETYPDLINELISIQSSNEVYLEDKHTLKTVCCRFNPL